MEDLENREKPHMMVFKEKAGSILARPLKVTLLEMVSEA